MYTKTTVVTFWSVLGATIIACAFFAGDVAAEGSTVSVAIRVSTRGIDFSEPAGARELYRRLKNAAWIACTRANRVGLQPSPDPEACSEKSLGEAILSAHMPLLTQVYLETHSLGQAAARGIHVPVAPVQVAEK